VAWPEIWVSTRNAETVNRSCPAKRIADHELIWTACSTFLSEVRSMRENPYGTKLPTLPARLQVVSDGGSFPQHFT
jgi:hypothetical protein